MLPDRRSGLISYLDANLLGVARPLARIRADVIHPGHPACPELHSHTKDEIWLAEAGRHGWVVLMRDKHIRRRPGERQALLDGGLRTFCLTSSGNSSKWEVLRLLVVNWPSIERTAHQRPGPYIYSVTSRGVRPLALGAGADVLVSTHTRPARTRKR